MAIEDAIYALNHTMKNTNVAVSEIIRQRDEAIQRADSNATQLKWANEAKNRHADRADKFARQNASLRGVITRMKKEASVQA